MELELEKREAMGKGVKGCASVCMCVWLWEEGVPHQGQVLYEFENDPVKVTYR